MLAALILVSAAAVVAVALLLLPKIKPAKKQSASMADLTEDAFAWVDLPWFGKSRPFRLRKLNLLEIMTSGEFPNTLIVDTMAAIDPGKKIDFSEAKQMELLEERKKLLETVARKSMVDPKYEEIRTIMRGSVGEDWDFDLGFMKAILDFQNSGIPDGAKKKSL